MFEKMFAVAIMIAVVGTVFHFFGEADAGPDAVMAPAPIVASAEMPDLVTDVFE